ncbi:hypothetical protein SM18_05441, partial [Klebsiella pneumoniae]
VGVITYQEYLYYHVDVDPVFLSI